MTPLLPILVARCKGLREFGLRMSHFAAVYAPCLMTVQRWVYGLTDDAWWGLGGWLFFSLSGGTCRYECGAPLTGPLVNRVVMFSPSVSVQYGCSGVLVLAVGQSCGVQVCI